MFAIVCVIGSLTMLLSWYAIAINIKTTKVNNENLRRLQELNRRKR